MKRFNKNVIVFVLAFLFVGFGFSFQYLNTLRYCVIDFLSNGLKSEGIDAFYQFTADVDSSSGKYLRYHDELMDLDSLKQFFLNTKLIQKDDTSVVKSEENTLIRPIVYCSEAHINNSVSAVQTLQDVSEESGADFLYIAVPGKNVVFSAPENIENHAAANFDRFIKALRQKDIPTLDLLDELRRDNMIKTSTYFLTDHHWKPETGFWATEKICATLSDEYGFEYNNDYTDLENYTTKTYPDWL